MKSEISLDTGASRYAIAAITTCDCMRPLLLLTRNCCITKPGIQLP